MTAPDRIARLISRKLVAFVVLVGTFLGTIALGADPQVQTILAGAIAVAAPMVIGFQGRVDLEEAKELNLRDVLDSVQKTQVALREAVQHGPLVDDNGNERT